jgi:uncharacterized membrane protein
MAEKEEEKKGEGTSEKNPVLISYILGILSIVLAFFNPFVGIILGVVGLVHGMKKKTELSKRARLLNIIGIIAGIVLIIFSVVMARYLTEFCANNPSNQICRIYFG